RDRKQAWLCSSPKTVHRASHERRPIVNQHVGWITVKGTSLMFALMVLPAASIASGDIADKRVSLVRNPWTTVVPKAKCGPYDYVETGLQGQTSVAERISGLSELGFNCNVELVGQFQGEGASYGMAWYKHCAYYGTANTPQQANRGVVVIDASDP